jgi:hypothetical protein
MAGNRFFHSIPFHSDRLASSSLSRFAGSTVGAAGGCAWRGQPDPGSVTTHGSKLLHKSPRPMCFVLPILRPPSCGVRLPDGLLRPVPSDAALARQGDRIGLTSEAGGCARLNRRADVRGRVTAVLVLCPAQRMPPAGTVASCVSTWFKRGRRPASLARQCDDSSGESGMSGSSVLSS